MTTVPIPTPPGRPILGIGQWFHFQTPREVERTIELMRDLGLRHIRTGISWADFVRPEGRRWYDWQMRALAEFDVLLSIWHTPPSISEGAACNSPPQDLKAFADFVDLVITEYGGCFAELELWNEPNNRLKWDFENFDPRWEKFGAMISMAAHWASHRGKRTVLGGMIPVDHHWLNLMKSHGAMHSVDVIAIHGFPHMWWPDAPCWDWHDHWGGWDSKVLGIRSHADGRPIWVTETGLATWDRGAGMGGRGARRDLQVRMLEEAAAAPVERVYWYSLIDLDPSLPAIEGFHVDENEYHLGLVTWEGEKKPAYHLMKELLAETSGSGGRRGALEQGTRPGKGQQHRG